MKKIGCGGWLCSNDLLSMSQMLYYLSYPASNFIITIPIVSEIILLVKISIFNEYVSSVSLSRTPETCQGCFLRFLARREIVDYPEC